MLSNLLLGSLSSLSELGTASIACARPRVCVTLSHVMSIGSEGKSGSFFYFTTDGKYMVKTISESVRAGK